MRAPAGEAGEGYVMKGYTEKLGLHPFEKTPESL